MSAYPYGQLPPGWEAEVLQTIQAPVTAANVQLLDAWTVAEQGNPARAAQFNPFNTTLDMPGSTLFNTLWPGGGVRNYPDWATGLKATAQTLLGSFPGIVSALRAGTATPATIYTSNWGTGQFSLGDAPAPSANFGQQETGGVGSSIPIIGGATSALGNAVQQALGLLGLATGPIGAAVQGATGAGTPTPLQGAEGAVGGAVSSALQPVLAAFGKTFGKWLVLIGLGLAALVVLDQLLTGGKGADAAMDAGKAALVA